MSEPVGDITQEQLKEILESYRDGLKLWQLLLISKQTLSQVKASKVDDPINELIKLCQLIHANTTKMGLIFEKPLKDVSAAYKQTREISSTSVLFISLCVQLMDSNLSKLFKDEIFILIKNLLSSLEFFIVELINEEDEKRLVSVGKIWDSVDQVVKIAKMGKLGVLNLKLKDSVTMINDGIEELTEWIEDPQGNDVDPFEMGEDEDDVSDPLPTPPLETNPSDIDDYSDIIPEAKQYLLKIKLVKLLLSSLIKSIPTDIKDNVVDEIFQLMRQINEQIDELIYKLIFENNLQETQVWFTQLSKTCLKVINILKDINVRDSKKLKWVSSWQLKFQEEIV